MAGFRIHFKLLPVVLVMVACLCFGCSGEEQEPETLLIATPELSPTEELSPTQVLPVPDASDFFRVSGTKIVNSEGEEVLLKGIAMGNMLWSSYEPVENDHTEDSFREIAELGFNCVRFYMSYTYFEDEDAPYQYKESGFEWLDQNIAWAKKYNIRLILNMHAPQGGYQSAGQGLALWENSENQERLIALWAEIAGRYAGEDTIIGYGLINEPVVPMLEEVPATVRQCSSLMQRIADAIRLRNRNHILFVEHLFTAVDPKTGLSDGTLTLEDVLYTIEDDNTVYEFHCYAPHLFTHQNLEWANTGGSVETYPSEKLMPDKVISYWTGCSPAMQTAVLEDGWFLYESGFAALSESENAGAVTLRAGSTGMGGSVLFDDIVIEEYKDGMLSRIVTELNFDTDEPDEFYFWSADGNGYYGYSDCGYGNSRCIGLYDTTADANITGYHFLFRDGYEYKIRGKVKYIATGPGCSAGPRIDYSLFESVTYCDYGFLEKTLLAYLEFGQKNQVPMYLGEFGVAAPAWEEGLGAAQWVSDMLELCKKYCLHFNYHAYHDYWFGLFRLPADDPARVRNEELAEVFCRLLKE